MPLVILAPLQLMVVVYFSIVFSSFALETSFVVTFPVILSVIRQSSAALLSVPVLFCPSGGRSDSLTVILAVSLSMVNSACTASSPLAASGVRVMTSV